FEFGIRTGFREAGVPIAATVAADGDVYPIDMAEAVGGCGDGADRRNGVGDRVFAFRLRETAFRAGHWGSSPSDIGASWTPHFGVTGRKGASFQLWVCRLLRPQEKPFPTIPMGALMNPLGNLSTASLATRW